MARMATRIASGMAAAAALPLALLAPTSAAADTPSTTTYHGVFTSREFTNCNDAPSVGVVSGTWNIIKRGDTDATVSINIFVNGKHHVSFGGPFPQTHADGSTAIVAVAVGTTLAGPLTISLTGDALTYAIPGYNYLGLSCPLPGGVTYMGSLGR
jgi:hypothetical protein